MSDAVVTVVIPAHNAGRVLGEQLEALSTQRGDVEFVTIVVLNRCTDDTAAVVASCQTKMALRTIVANDKASAAYARNVGAGASDSDFILFCDADDEVGPDWVAEMVAALHSADFVGGVAELDVTGLPAWAHKGVYRNVGIAPFNSHDSRLLYPISASLGCTRGAFDAVGGFDETFPGAAGEEIDFALRLYEAGRRLGLARRAKYRYRPRTGFHSIANQQRAYARGNAILAQKEGTLIRPRLLSEWQLAVKVAAYAVIRRREFHPAGLAMTLMSRCFRVREFRRRSSRETPATMDPAQEVNFTCPLDVPVIGGLGFLARAGPAHWYADVGVEATSIALLDRLLPVNGTMVDGGANIGTFAVAAAKKVGRFGRVIAFEPDVRTVSLLQRNARRHNVASVVDVRPQAIGADKATGDFKAYDNDVVSGLVFSPNAHAGEVDAVENVDIVRLDEAVTGPIDFLKLDIEGFEVSALEGASQLLTRSPNVCVLVELNPAALQAAGRTPRELLECFPRDRWALWLVEDQRSPDRPATIRPIDDLDALGANSGASQWYANVLAVPMHRHGAAAAAIETVLKRDASATP